MSTGLCIFGEVLYDHFPDGHRVLGGAPFNVAWHLQALGQAPLFISRVGSDPQGDAIRAAMEDWGMDTTALQIDDELPTGEVNVRIVGDEPEYEIVHPVAWDAIEIPEPTPGCFVLYHGSLALRRSASRSTLEQLKANGPAIVFVDVNLRQPWCERQQVLEWVHGADWVKLNAEELNWLSPPGKVGPDDQAATFLAEHGLQALVLTHGAGGAELLTAAGGRHRTEAVDKIEVVDSVGAGDAFSAVMILGLLLAWSPELTLHRAQTFASAIVGRRGATVDDRDYYQAFIEDWTSGSAERG